MFRILTISLLSFICVVPFLALFHRFMGLDDGIAGYLSFFFAWLVLPIFLFRVWKEKIDPMVIPIDPEDPIMASHIDLAVRNIDKLYLALDEGKLEAFVKFPYNFDRTGEHIWGLAHQAKGDSIVVSLESSPISEIPEEMYQRMAIAKEKIEDWTLVDSKGNIQGGYTILAHAKIYERDYGTLPKEYAEHLAMYTDFSWPENSNA